MHYKHSVHDHCWNLSKLLPRKHFLYCFNIVTVFIFRCSSCHQHDFQYNKIYAFIILKWYVSIMTSGSRWLMESTKCMMLLLLLWDGLPANATILSTIIHNILFFSKSYCLTSYPTWLHYQEIYCHWALFRSTIRTPIYILHQHWTSLQCFTVLHISGVFTITLASDLFLKPSRLITYNLSTEKQQCYERKKQLFKSQPLFSF